MEHLQVWSFFSLIVLTAASPAPPPSYLLLVPESIQPSVPTSVSVSILMPSAVTVSAHLVHGGQSVASTSATVDGGSTQLLTLPAVNDSESSHMRQCTLEVKGHVGEVEVFSNSTLLYFNRRWLSTFIQTDQSIYRAGQEVKIRVVSIHPDGKPFLSPADVIVKDPRGNLLRQWLEAEAVLGVVSREFELSEDPPLGRWTVVAKVGSISTEKHFSVGNHDEQKFQVVIKAPRILHHEETLQGYVAAKGVSGKPIQGHMNITLRFYSHGAEDGLHESREIDGTADFLFDLPEYRAMKKRNAEPDYYNYYDDGYMEDECLAIVVHVTEHLTGITYNSTAKVCLAKFRYKVSFEGYPQILRPFLNFTAWLKISTYDDRPLSPEDQQKVAHVSVMQREQSPWSWMQDEWEAVAPRWSNMSDTSGNEHVEDMTFPVPADGMIPLYIRVRNRTETLIIAASFEDGHNTLQLYRSYTSPSHSYMQIKKPSGPLQVGSPFPLHIERNFPMTEIHYTVMSRGQVVSAGKSSAVTGLLLVPEISWAPLACIVVYCVHPSGEIVNDAMQLSINGALQNRVSLEWSATSSEPGSEVTLRVAAMAPGSLVAILVVDKATQWEGSQNDITKQTVLKEMGDYSVPMGDAHSFRMGDPYSVFKMCRLAALTDACLNATRNHMKPNFAEEGVQHQPPPSSLFPETWIWKDVNTGDWPLAEVTLTVPDSLTSWTAKAFVMSEDLGLGFTETPAELVVFQDLSLFLNLPAAVVRGEELMLEVVLFNFLPQEQQVLVEVEQSEALEFVLEDEGLLTPNLHSVRVEAQSWESFLVPIRPLVLGEVVISVTATSGAASHSARRTLLVKAEGLEQSYSTSLLLELSAPQTSLSRDLMFSFPPDVVEGSRRVSVTAVGDLLGPSISGLGALIQMPYGCGEQNMINFAPNVYALMYMSVTGQEDQDTVDRATTYMIKGYERELTYQRDDGSFSAFGNSDASGSTWLTAFVLKCFQQAHDFLVIDGEVLRRAASWLVAQQGADGRFNEPGRVIHTELQGGLDGPTALTAFVLCALLEGDDLRAQYAGQVSTAAAFLESRLSVGVASNYSLSLLTYALALDGSARANEALSQLIGRAETSDGVPTWSSPGGGLVSSWQPRSVDIEMASYLLLAQVRLGLMAEGVALMKWLSQQRNFNGGYGSTQDTVMALQALCSAAGDGAGDMDLTVTVVTDGATAASFYIHEENRLVHQSQQIEGEDELELQVTAEGRGLALFQLNVFYNVWSAGLLRRRRDAGEHGAFLLHVELFDTEMNSAHLHICYSLVDGLGLSATGMAIMEVGLLSGFSLVPGGVNLDQVVKRVETKPGKVILYLDSVTMEEVCLLVPLLVENKVGFVQEAATFLYDYYEPRRRVEKTYNSPRRSSMSSTSFCIGECKGTVFGSAASGCSAGVVLTAALLLLSFTFHL